MLLCSKLWAAIRSGSNRWLKRALRDFLNVLEPSFDARSRLFAKLWLSNLQFSAKTVPQLCFFWGIYGATPCKKSACMGHTWTQKCGKPLKRDYKRFLSACRCIPAINKQFLVLYTMFPETARIFSKKSPPDLRVTQRYTSKSHCVQPKKTSLRPSEPAPRGKTFISNPRKVFRSFRSSPGGSPAREVSTTPISPYFPPPTAGCPIIA